MKKPFVLISLLCLTACLFAQNDTASYYYKGKKLTIAVTYKQVIIGLKHTAAARKSKALLAVELGVPADSIQATAKPNQFVIKAAEQKDKISTRKNITKLRTNKSVAYLHPFLLTPQGKPVSYGNEFTVKLKAGTSYQKLKNLLAKYHCSIFKKYPFAQHIYILSAGEANGYDALKMANTFFESGLFEYAEPDFTMYDALTEAPNDPLYNLQWAHKNTGSPEQYNGIPGADMQVDSAWQITMGDAEIKIAVIDTGVDTAHADLKANLLQGYDCITGTSNPGDGHPKNDKNSHGTACAGIVAAVANNNIGIAGIAPNCKLIPINLSDENNMFVSDIGKAAGFDYAWQNGAAVISNSWYGGLPSNTIDDAIHRAVTMGRQGKGSIVLFATGNDNGGISYPANNPEVIAVGGISMCNQRKNPQSCDGESWWGANYGAGLDVVAPCVKIATTDISGAGGYNETASAEGDYFNTFNGTSSACPQAAGVAALILSANKSLTAKEARIVLENSCTKIDGYQFAMTAGNPNGTWNNELGYGRVNAYKAVQTAQSGKFCNVIIKASGPVMLCKGNAVTLNVVEPVGTATYQWRLNEVENGSTDSSLEVSAAGTYDVTATYTNGCVAISTSLKITVPGDEKLLANAGSGVSICPSGEGVRIGGMPSAEGGMPFISDRRGFGIETFLGNGLMHINLDNPIEYDYKTIQPSPQVNDRSFHVGDFTPLGYYVLTGNNNLVRIDTATGTQDFIATLIPEKENNFGQSWSGLAWDPSSQQLYALTGGGYANRLYKVDLLTGSLTVAAQLNNNYISWIAFNKAGTLFGYLSQAGRLGRIDKNTGIIQSFSDAVGVNMLTQLDGAVDPLDGKLYLSTFYVQQKITNDIRRIDTLTGKVQLVGSVGDFSQVSALAIAGGVYKYSWFPQTGLSNPLDANPVANPEQTTVYTLTVTDYCGDTATAKVKVTAGTSPPQIAVTAERDSICVGETVRLSATQNSNYYYQWINNDKEIPGATDTFYVAQRMGNFQVRVTNGRGGCANTSALFQVKDCSVILNNNNTDTTCYSYFYPSQGYQKNAWLANESWEKTIYPSGSGTVLGVKFNSFVSKSIHDVLTIYDGPNSSSPVIRRFNLSSNPRPVDIYYSSSGPLTFTFTSSDLQSGAGNWDAFLSCYQSKVFRSKQSGKFEDISTWQVKAGAGYVDAAAAPTYLDDSIIIQSGHTVNLLTNNYNPLDQLWIQKGAKLICSGYLTLKTGPQFEVVADGDIELSDNAFISGDGTAVLLRGDFKGISTYTNAGFFMDGTVPQTVSFKNATLDSVTLINSASINMKGIISARYLKMNTTGRLSFDSSFNIARTLILNNGIIDVKGSLPLKFTESAAIIGGGKNSFINGQVFWVPLPYTGEFHYFLPIGYNNIYKPLALHIKKRNYFNGQQFKISALSGPLPVRNLPAGINRVSTINYYKIEAAKNDLTDSVTITLPYNEDDQVTDTASLRIVKDDGAGNWKNLGGMGNSADTGTITCDSSFKQFGDFALAYTTGTLPVNWISFTASPYGKQVKLKWDVASEVNIAYYTVEHSVDGTLFKTIAQLPVQNSGANRKSYQWLHGSPVSGINFYRIKQVDKDGRFSYSKTEKLQLNSVKGCSITPNPAGNEIVITADDVIKQINCYDIQGRLLKTVKASSLQVKLLLNPLPAGTYNIRVVTESQVYNIKLLKR